MADPMQQAREFLAVAHENAGDPLSAEAVRKGWNPVPTVELAAIAAALRAALEWQPIETAPEGKLIVVAWLDDEGGERQEFDYIEDGMWIHHADLVEHAQMVAPPGSKIPKEQPPYQWWMDLPVLPAARPQGVKDGR